MSGASFSSSGSLRWSDIRARLVGGSSTMTIGDQRRWLNGVSATSTVRASDFRGRFAVGRVTRNSSTDDQSFYTFRPRGFVNRMNVAVIGAGGGGGNGGGGGGGQYLALNNVSTNTSTNEAIRVGRARDRGNAATRGRTSQFRSSVSAGGGNGGGSNANPRSGSSGGGGGAASFRRNGQSGTSGQGHRGGNNVGRSDTLGRGRGGGGGGISSRGFDSNESNEGGGGNGLRTSITGTNVWYGGGGKSAGSGPTGNGGGGGGDNGGGGNSNQVGSHGLVIIRAFESSGSRWAVFALHYRNDNGTNNANNGGNFFRDSPSPSYLYYK